MVKKREILSEFLGTYFLIFFCAGAGVINSLTNNSIGHIGGSFISGIAVMVLIYTFGHISGAHFNPVVTLAFLLRKEITLKKSFLYIIVQLLGSFLAALTLKTLFGSIANLGATLPQKDLSVVFFMEFLLTFILLFVIMGAAVHGRATKALSGIVIGGAVVIGCLIGGGISGAAMNPARTFGSSLLSGNIDSLWIYFLAPTLGGIFATFIYGYIHEKE